MLCDKHVVKMPLESAQMLCSAFPQGRAPYKRTHFNHSCSVWARRSKKNYEWLIQHALALCDEYTHRYGKTHKSREVILWCAKNRHRIRFPHLGRSRFAPCFDVKYHLGSIVMSYREYYRREKAAIATWSKTRAQPAWFTYSAQQQS
jgi:hypothetical protein